MAGDEPVERVEHACWDRPQDACDRAREAERTCELDRAAAITERPAASDETPGRVPLSGRHVPEESRCLGVVQREEQERSVPVESHDRPGREPAEPAVIVVEEDGPSRIHHVSILGQRLQTAPTLSAMARFGGRALGLLAIVGAVVFLGAARAATSPALAVSVTGVTAGPFSATVRWQASAPASVVVEYGLTDDYGVWSRRVASGQDRAGRSGLSSLEPGRRYVFRVLARSGSERAVASGAATTGPMPLWVSAGVTARALTIAGQPFYPRMVWNQCPWEYPQSLAAGVNVYMGTGCGDLAAQASALQGRAFSVLSLDDRGHPIPGTIGFHQPDEADEHVPSGSDLPSVPSSSATGRPTFLTLTNHFFTGAAPLPQGRSAYPTFVARAEMIGFDLYPLQIWCRRDTLQAVFDAQRELVALAAGKPTYQWIEAGSMSMCPWLSPSPAILRAETWLAIAGGARGIGWFPDYWSQPIADEVGELSRDIVSLSSALLGDEAPVSVTPADTPVRVGARTANGATYVIAVNSWTAPATVRIAVPGLTARSVRVWGTKTVLPVRNGAIVDSFRGLRVKVYVAAPPGL